MTYSASCKKLCRRLLIILTLLLCAGFGGGAFAETPTGGPACDGSDLSTYGMSVELVYCVHQSLKTATKTYSDAVTAALKPYMAACVLLAIVLFGLRMVTMGVEQLTSDSIVFVFKLATALYIFNNAYPLYLFFISAIDETISWVSSGINLSNCTTTLALPAGVTSSDYAVWQSFDCMFSTMFGLNNLAGTVVFIIGAIFISAVVTMIFSVSFTIFVALLGITAFVAVLMTLSRAIYTVLLSYITIAFLMVIAPLMAPLLVFNSHNSQSYTKKLFERWLSLIVSTIFQPMFIMGFLAFTIQVVDVYIDGTHDQFPYCYVSSLGHQETSVCSFKQLFAGSYHIAPQSIPIQNVIGDVLAEVQGAPGTIINATDHFKSWTQWWNAVAVAPAEQAVAGAVALAVPAFTALDIATEIIIQFGITLCAFIISCLVLRKMMDIVPALARTMTLSVGIGLIKGASMPFEHAVLAAVKGFGEGAKAAARAASGSKGFDKLGAGAKAAGSGLMQGIRAGISSNN